MVTDDPKLLAEDDRGYLLVPDRRNPGTWRTIFNPLYPPHWRCWLRSRRKLQIAMVEGVNCD